MVARTAKLVGRAYSLDPSISATFEVIYNGTIVFSGSVPTIVQEGTLVSPPPGQVPDPTYIDLCDFATDTDTTGQMPVQITVTSGLIVFNHILMNYTISQYPNPNPPIGYWVYDDATSTWKVNPSLNFDAPQTVSIESDGVSNTVKNGQVWNWRVDPTGTGYWGYPVYENETFTFDYFVDPAKITLDPFTPTGPTP